jgi:Flp pilus assembly protein TadG
MRYPSGDRALNERGAILVQVALSILVLMGFSVFVVDYGVVWVARGQAQNAADAGALAGAVALAYDEPTNTPAAEGIAWTAAMAGAQANDVWGTAATPVANVGSVACPAGVAGRCARVDVHRNGTNGSDTLPVLFGSLLGVTTQGVRATATARVAFGNATNCMRPFAVADQWEEVRAPVGQYNRWTSSGNTVVELNPHDIYTPPSAAGPGTGFRLPDDLGVETILKNGNPNNDNENIVPGWFMPIRLPDGNGGYDSGADDYRTNIRECLGQPVRIGDYLPVENGAMIGPSSQGFNDLRALDPNARWDVATNSVVNSCAPSCAPFSPRVIPLPVFDIDEYQLRRAQGNWSHCPTGGKCVKVVNILGFFADRMQGSDIIGYLLMYPGIFVTGAPNVSEDATFLVTVQLIR